MIDKFRSTVGSCAQIGKRVHRSGGVGIGGVLEPLQANPTIIEDDCFIGARSEIVEGVIVRQGAVVAMGGCSAPRPRSSIDTGARAFIGEVPEYAVVVPGMLPARPLKNGLFRAFHSPAPSSSGASTSALRAKTSINELLRTRRMNLPLPRLRGEGWGEGDSDGRTLRIVPLTRNSRFARISTSPRKRGEVNPAVFTRPYSGLRAALPAVWRFKRWATPVPVGFFKGRINRARYIAVQLALLTVWFMVWVNPLHLSSQWEALSSVVTIVMIWINAATTARRLHDRNWSGWWAVAVIIVNRLFYVYYGLFLGNYFGVDISTAEQLLLVMLTVALSLLQTWVFIELVFMIGNRRTQPVRA